MDFVFLKIFKGIGGFQGYGFGFWHSSDHGGLQVLDLVLQAFIEYWWFSGSWIWFFRHSSNIGGFQGLGFD